MSELLENVRRLRESRSALEEDYRAAVRAAREAHSVPEIAAAAGLTVSGVYYLLSPTQAGRKRENR